jgi:hypothetical protein
MDVAEPPVRIYLDACCFSRLSDDQSQSRIRREAEAIETILGRIEQGIWELVSSEALENEVKRNPSNELRFETQTLLSLATSVVEVDTEVERRAEQLAFHGYGSYDAAALRRSRIRQGRCTLTTDDSFSNRSARGIGNPLIAVRNPLSWLEERYQ